MTLTHQEKNIRKNRKKARISDRKYKETRDVKFLREKDIFNDIADNMDQMMVEDKVVIKVNIVKSDEQIFNEANSFNRKIRNEAERTSHISQQKNERMKERHKFLKRSIREKHKIKDELNKTRIETDKEKEKKMKQYRDTYIKGYIEGGEGVGNSKAQKEFVRDFNKTIEFMKLKEEVIMKCMGMGMDRVTADKTFANFIKMD